ncbi:phage terminase large subunit [Thermoactinomyces daqus]|uniref:Phage terminase large subunit n=1 Tax=Thermoactinomyces daqus TaxID=1329516 RepID=A0A7W1X8I6_9BACL|nr:phage terminase large subunit [Thermoactinomyces daqus]
MKGGGDVLDYKERIDREKRRARMKLLEEYNDLLEKKKRKESGLSERELKTYIDNLEELKVLQRIDRAEEDILYFMYEYFSANRNPENETNLVPDPNFTMDDAPEFHRELCDMLRQVTRRELKKVAYAAPRGHAKSAYLSNCFPLHEVVYNKRKYILIISETDGMAQKFVEWIADQLKHNAKLRNDFGSLLEVNPRKNERDNQEAFLTHTGILVEASSMGKQLRGKRNKSYQPDLVILDDLESAKNTNTADLREKNLEWLNKVVMPIGDKETAFVYMGTIVHVNGLLPYVLNSADFKSKIYRAIVQPAERTDLWDQFAEILRNRTDPDRMEKARRLYEENRDEMLRGARVLWEYRWSYFDLMVEKVERGTKAFNSEYQNNPIDEESQRFRPETFIYFDYKDLIDEKTKKPITLEYYGFWDPAVGKKRGSDYNAIVIIGRCRRTGVLYVRETWAKQCPASVAMTAAIDLIQKYNPRIFGVETIQAQHDYYVQLRTALTKAGHYTTKLKPVPYQAGKKEDRIDVLEPLFENGTLRLMRHQHLLIEQLEMFPSGDHDDLPDALASCVNLAGGTRMRKSYYKKPLGL